MDIYCPKCREPWDMDCLNEEALARVEEEGGTYEQRRREVHKEFYRIGCPAIKSYDARCNPDTLNDPNENNQIIQAAYEMMGEDEDAAASMLEDWFG